MKNNILPIIVICLVIPTARADTITVRGITYENIRWGTITPSKATFFYKGGVMTVNISDLPKDLQEKFNYDSQMAQDHNLAVNARFAERHQKLDDEKRRLKELEDVVIIKIQVRQSTGRGSLGNAMLYKKVEEQEKYTERVDSKYFNSTVPGQRRRNSEDKYQRKTRLIQRLRTTDLGFIYIDGLSATIDDMYYEVAARPAGIFRYTTIIGHEKSVPKYTAVDLEKEGFTVAEFLDLMMERIPPHQ